MEQTFTVVALAAWRGGSVAREAKALAPSECVWAAEGKGTAPILYQEILDCSVRSIDPFVRLQKSWIVRRLAPDCSRIELSALPKQRDEIRLLRAMGLNPSFRYEKYRTRFKLGSLHLDLDETPVGTFLELEGQPKAINRVAKALGYSDRDYIRGTYWDLFNADRRRRGSRAKNMLFTHKNGQKSKGSA